MTATLLPHLLMKFPEDIRYRIAKAIWDLERTSEKDAQWPSLDESLRQPHCQSAYRIADTVLKVLSKDSIYFIEGPQDDS